MSNFNLSPNMSLPIPTVGVDPGPDWALNYNSCFTIVEGHNHSTGNGVQITPTGLNINADLTFGINNATNVKSIRFSAQSSLPATSPNLACAYVIGADLYYNDANGNQIRITQSGSVTGATGTITGLPSGTASAAYNSISETFIFQSASNTAANIDGGSILIREVAANANAVTISSPTSLASNYALVLPAALPSAQYFMTLDNAGAIAASIPISLGITASNIASNAITTAKIIDDAVTTPKILNDAVTTAKILDLNVTTNKIASLAVTADKLAASNIVFSSSSGAFSLSPGALTGVTNASINVATAGIRPIAIAIIADGTTNPSFLLQASGSGASYSENYLLRNAGGPNTTIAAVKLENNTNGAASASITWGPTVIWTIDQPPGPGTYNYTYQVQTFNAVFQANYVRMVAIEL